MSRPLSAPRLMRITAPTRLSRNHPDIGGGVVEPAVLVDDLAGNMMHLPCLRLHDVRPAVGMSQLPVRELHRLPQQRIVAGFAQLGR